jgi:hypothetical protein
MSTRVGYRDRLRSEPIVNKTMATIVLIWTLLYPVGAAAQSVKLGAKCAARSYGTSSGPLICALVAKGRYAWVQVPSPGNESEEQAGPAKAVVARPDGSSIPPGQWLVGPEVTPGTYRTVAADCYYLRLSGFTGGSGSIIDNGFTSTSGGLVTILSTDKAFESRCAWTRTE